MSDNNSQQQNHGVPFLRPMKVLDTGMTYVERLICLISTIIMVVIILCDIFFRNMLHSSIFWAQELARYMMILSVFFGCSICVKEKAHLGIDSLFNHLPPKTRKVITYFIAAFATAGFIILAVLQFRFAANSLRISQTTPTLYIQYGYLYATVGVAMIFSAIRSIMVILNDYVYSGMLFNRKEGK